MTREPGHPRPQLRREGWQDLCGRWGFAFDDEDVGRSQRWQHQAERFDRRIEVPFPFESPASGIGDPSFHPVVWYRREVALDPTPGRQQLLHFGAVDYRADVWVNGAHVASHEGGHTPFSADVTHVLDPAGTQVVVVRAQDGPTDLSQPRGKQDWRLEPSAIWYDRTTGIWQPVWWEQLPPSSIRALRWGGDIDAVALDLDATVDTAGRDELRLRVVLTVGDRLLADDSDAVTAGRVQRRIGLPAGVTDLPDRELLWSPDRPTLIDATLSLLDADGAVLDEVQSYAGLRSIGVDRGRVTLNGRPVFLRLVLAQNYWPESHLAAPSADALRREVELAKQLGFDGVRLHQKIEDPRFLAWCDRLGLLVWEEMPSAYVFSEESVRRLTREWLEVLERDANHPCVIAWVPFNESWGVPALAHSPQQRALVRALVELTRAIDPHRLCVGNDGWEHVASDLVTVHDYAAEAGTLQQRYGDAPSVAATLSDVQPGDRPIVLTGSAPAGSAVLVTELGGVSFDPVRPEDWHGYASVASSEELLTRYRDLVGALLDSPALAGFCWTQLTDTRQETNGLLRADRTAKAEVALLHAATRRPAAAIAGEAVTVPRPQPVDGEELDGAS